MLEAGATFVARGFSGRPDHLTELFVGAVEHRGFSFVEVMQPCITFNNTYALYNELVEELGEPASDRRAAGELARRKDRLPIGILFREDKAPFHEELLDGRVLVRDHPDREARLRAVDELLGRCGPDTIEKGECR
jgi:2-oxoglutarate ferredoxin oxidoreductase subunit beta